MAAKVGLRWLQTVRRCTLSAFPNAEGRTQQAACGLFQGALVGYGARREVVDRRRSSVVRPSSFHYGDVVTARRDVCG